MSNNVITITAVTVTSQPNGNIPGAVSLTYDKPGGNVTMTSAGTIVYNMGPGVVSAWSFVNAIPCNGSTGSVDITWSASPGALTFTDTDTVQTEDFSFLIQVINKSNQQSYNSQDPEILNRPPQ